MAEAARDDVSEARLAEAHVDAVQILGEADHPVVTTAKKAAERGIDVEIIDLRSLSPVDFTAIERSVKKTSRVIVAYEDAVSWGYGAEIAARIADELFDYLDAPVKRVAALDCFVSYAPDVEDAILPQVEDFRRAPAPTPMMALLPPCVRPGPSPRTTAEDGLSESPQPN